MPRIDRPLNPGPLWYWMEERHNIYLRKELRDGADPDQPLTEDPILQTYRFCNVFRELDRVTIWIKENLRDRYADHEALWIILAIARTINWPPTLAYLHNTGALPTYSDWKPSILTNALEKRAASGEKVYTGAYMIRAESDPNKPWYDWSKHRYIAEIVIGRLWEDREQITYQMENGRDFGLEATWRLFQQPRYIGWGPFMAYEVVTDMRHTRYLRNAPDIYTWANAGPGALRGLNRLRGLPVTHPLGQEQANELMRELLTMAGERNWPMGFPAGGFEMRDIEHSLCEVDKYLRVANGEGRPRAKYVPGRGH